MNQKIERIEAALTSAITLTMEEMVFEQAERIFELEQIKEFEAGEVMSVAISDVGGEESTDKGMASTASPRLWATCPLISPLAGEVVLEVERGYAQRMSEVLFGLFNQNPPEEIIMDALAEVLNTVAGCFMKEMIPPDQEYVIGFPQAGRGLRSHREERGPELYFEVGDFVIKVAVAGSDFHIDDAQSIMEQEVLR